MAVTVIDASALAAVVFGEASSDDVIAQVAGRQAVAPGLIWFELSNICLKKMRRHPERASEFLALLGEAPAIQVEVRDVEHRAVVALAHQTGLSAYDANYLWLARLLDTDLITLDQPLAAAWRQGPAPRGARERPVA
jgi:predicted nucleic acid-binding protein